MYSSFDFKMLSTQAAKATNFVKIHIKHQKAFQRNDSTFVKLSNLDWWSLSTFVADLARYMFAVYRNLKIRPSKEFSRALGGQKDGAIPLLQWALPEQQSNLTQV